MVKQNDSPQRQEAKNEKAGVPPSPSGGTPTKGPNVNDPNEVKIFHKALPLRDSSISQGNPRTLGATQHPNCSILFNLPNALSLI